MVSAENTSKIFINLKSDPENNKCLDCELANPNFASIANGCFLCSTCSLSHLSLGPEISLIKSLDSNWTEEQLKLIVAGGNSSLKDFFNHYGITSMPISVKYMTKASFFYREMLAVVAQDGEYEKNCPGIEEGIQVIGRIDVESKAEETKNTGFIKKSAWDWAKEAYVKTVDAGNKAADEINKKISKIAEKPSVKRVENKTIEIAERIESGFSELFNKIHSRPEVQEVVGKVNHIASSVANEVKYTYVKVNANPAVQKIKSDTMNMLRDVAVSFK